MQNRFKRYNKSLLIVVFMSKEYKFICDKDFIPKYDEINKTDYWNWTPLIRTCNWNKMRIARLLLSHPDVNVNYKNNYGKISALDWAENYRNKQLIKLLQSYNAQ